MTRLVISRNIKFSRRLYISTIRSAAPSKSSGLSISFLPYSFFHKLNPILLMPPFCFLKPPWAGSRRVVFQLALRRIFLRRRPPSGYIAFCVFDWEIRSVNSSFIEIMRIWCIVRYLPSVQSVRIFNTSPQCSLRKRHERLTLFHNLKIQKLLCHFIISLLPFMSSPHVLRTKRRIDSF